MPELAREIAEATAFVLLVGKNGLGPWQTIEYYEAFNRRAKEHDFPVILLLLDGEPAPGLPFLTQLHWIVTANPESEQSVAKLIDAAAGRGAPPGELWRHTAPYRGLSAMTESDADFFFGRTRETAEVLGALRSTPDKIPLLLGNSGVGKSSVAQAGVLAALMRQDWPATTETVLPWPQVFRESRRWCFLKLKPGVQPVRALVEPFVWTWQFDAVDPKRAELQSNWSERLLDGRLSLRDLLDATQARYRDDLHQPEPPMFMLYVDQGEELYVRACERERQRFSEIIAHALPDLRLRVMMSMRSDFLGTLQKDEALYAVHRQINVPPLREAQLREVVGRPAETLSARFEPPGLIDIITLRTAEDSVKDVGALPLLSYTLDDMWTQMVRRGDGKLRLPAQSFELGGVLVDRANTFLATHPGAEAALRRILTLRCATVREDGEPTRRRAYRSEFSDEEWRLVSELADFPNRLLVTVTPEDGETYAELAHEAIFRRWDKLHDWMAAEREFLIWRSGLEIDLHRWEAAPAGSKEDALLMGLGLWQALTWLEKRRNDLPQALCEFIVHSENADVKRREAARQQEILRVKAEGELARLKAEQDAHEQRERANTQERARREAEIVAAKARVDARRLRILVGVLSVVIVTGVTAWEFRALREFVFWFSNVRDYVLTADRERTFTLKQGGTFRECAKVQERDYCPEMVVVPAGSFEMGSPATETSHKPEEEPLHRITIAKPFAVAKFELTFDEWDICVAYGDCRHVNDFGWGRGQQPVIDVAWDDAQQYVAWFSKLTGKHYRLLTEAEYEYAARAGKQTAYPWGDTIGDNNSNCRGCGSQWDGKKPGPVNSFAANGFGLYDMVGNIWEWVEDCYHSKYEVQTPEGRADAPTDGSEWKAACPDVNHRVIRGGSWTDPLENIRSATRPGAIFDLRGDFLGFRLGRTLSSETDASTVPPGAH